MEKNRSERWPAMLAAGFALLYASLTLNFPTVAIEIAPDFLGWLLLFLAARRLPKAFGLSPRVVTLCGAMAGPMLLVQTILFFRLNGERSAPVTAARIASFVLACAVGLSLCRSVRRAEAARSKSFGGARLRGAWFAAAALSFTSALPLRGNAVWIAAMAQLCAACFFAVCTAGCYRRYDYLCVPMQTE